MLDKLLPYRSLYQREALDKVVELLFVSYGCDLEFDRKRCDTRGKRQPILLLYLLLS